MILGPTPVAGPKGLASVDKDGTAYAMIHQWRLLFFSFHEFPGRNPELCGEVHPDTAPLQAVYSAFALQNRAPFEGKKRERRRREKGRKRGDQQRGQKGKMGA